ncbi:carbohydrate esterase family 3 protein [Xylariomycetidae sp. FL2044]|nr:carbohydrate esterase family 3 protein [Xylariomycetidae sp. FL2044]
MLKTDLLLSCFIAWASTVYGSTQTEFARAHTRSFVPRAEGFGNGVPLRIMPLGASITYGLKSTYGNGYRKSLYDQIVKVGNKVTMVGSHPNGTMQDNASEGWPSYVIDSVRDKASEHVPEFKPNLVLINAGTNDCSKNLDIAKAGERMENLMNTVWDGSSKATIILSTLLVNANEKTQERVKDVNGQYQKLANRLQDDHKRVVLVDMQGPDGPTKDELVDGTHPNDQGYIKMANVWMAGIKTASGKDFLQEPEAVKKS